MGQIYDILSNFPREEIYGLTSQIRCSAVSIPSNITKGQSRGSDAAFANHINIASGSASKRETRFTIAWKIENLVKTDYDSLLVKFSEIIRMLYDQRSKLKKSIS